MAKRPMVSQYLSSVWSVFVGVAFFVYTWSMLVTLWEIPSLSMYAQAADVLGYVAYQFMFCALESVLVTIFVVGLSMVLPAKWMRKTMPASGILLSLSLGISALAYKALPATIQWTAHTFPLPRNLLYQFPFGAWIFVTLLLSIYALISARSASLSGLARKLTQQASLLIGLYAAASALSVVVVVWRNIR